MGWSLAVPRLARSQPAVEGNSSDSPTRQKTAGAAACGCLFLRRTADDMPLTPDAGILPSKFNGVYFVMFNGAERVLCLADYAALQDLSARHRMTEDFLEVFRAFRPEIEKRASAKFDAGDRDANGNVVLIGTDLDY